MQRLAGSCPDPFRSNGVEWQTQKAPVLVQYSIPGSSACPECPREGGLSAGFLGVQRSEEGAKAPECVLRPARTLAVFAPHDRNEMGRPTPVRAMGLHVRRLAGKASDRKLRPGSDSLPWPLRSCATSLWDWWHLRGRETENRLDIPGFPVAISDSCPLGGVHRGGGVRIALRDQRKSHPPLTFPRPFLFPSSCDPSLELPHPPRNQ